MAKTFQINAPWKENDPVHNFLVMENARQVALRIAVANIEDKDKKQEVIALAANHLGIRFDYFNKMVELEKKNISETEDILSEMSSDERLYILSMPTKLHMDYQNMGRRIR